jgi:hypothetical protein
MDKQGYAMAVDEKLLQKGREALRRLEERTGAADNFDEFCNVFYEDLGAYASDQIVGFLLLAFWIKYKK